MVPSLKHQCSAIIQPSLHLTRPGVSPVFKTKWIEINELLMAYNIIDSVFSNKTV